MSNHPPGCPCVNCNPVACTLCGLASPGGTHLRFSVNVCRHRRACEGRQMLNAGTPVATAAAHAQSLREPPQ
jgi:hypothetical protein